MISAASIICLVAGAVVAQAADKPVDIYALRTTVLKSQIVLDKITKTCQAHKKVPDCEARAGDALFCQLLSRSHPDLAAAHCASGKAKAAPAFLQLGSKIA